MKIRSLKKMVLALAGAAMLTTMGSTAALAADGQVIGTQEGTCWSTITKRSEEQQDFDVTVYPYYTNIGEVWYYAVITNNTDTPVHVEGKGIAKDSAGNTLEYKNMNNLEVLGAHETSFAEFIGVEADGLDHFDYSLEYSVATRYRPVLSNLTFEERIEGTRKPWIAATNNGDYTAEFVEGMTFFMDADDNILETQGNYTTDTACELKPGATISMNLYPFNKDYDHAVVFWRGRADK